MHYTPSETIRTSKEKKNEEQERKIREEAKEILTPNPLYLDIHYCRSQISIISMIVKKKMQHTNKSIY